MKASVRDEAALLAVNPSDLGAYLHSTGWRDAGRFLEHGALWAGGEARDLEVLQPLDRNLADYAARIADALEVLGVAENRSQLEILSDITLPSLDVIRIPLAYSTTGDGTIPIDQGVPAVQHAREMVMAAARAALETRAYYRGRAQEPVTGYMETVRLGQTERGSYTLTVLSPVAGPPQAPLDGMPQDPTDDPFGRKVTITLARSLCALREAAEEARDGELQPFIDSVARGVSANLCDAVTGLLEPTVGEAAIHVTWARTRTVSEALPRRIAFSPRHFPLIEQASRTLKEAEPVDTTDIAGVVISLRRDEDTMASGMVSIKAVIGQKARSVKIVLEPDAYQMAVNAHGAGFPIRCTGRLEEVGGRLALLDPTDFRHA